MTTAIEQPRIARYVPPIVHLDRVVHLAPLDSTAGQEYCLDVRLGVGFAPTICGMAASFEDDPVTLVVVNAMVPCRDWETAAVLLGRHHRDHQAPEAALLPDGTTHWMTVLRMPNAWVR